MTRLSCCPFDSQTVGGARSESQAVGRGDSWIWVVTGAGREGRGGEEGGGGLAETLIVHSRCNKRGDVYNK